VNVLVDTSVWSLALRRKRGGLKRNDKALVAALTDLIRDDRVVMIGPVRQELLSGLRSEQEFEQLRERLADFDDEPLVTADYEEAGRCHNQCRAAGLAGSPVDFLLCAVAIRRGLAVFTTDADFERYADCLSLALHRLVGT
jgi:predicted nucleic acid-binding protein